MEPMTLGSPNGPPSPATNNPYLPAFLMGESIIIHTPRNNTLSPTKGRTTAFAQSPGPTSPDFNKSKSFYGFQSPQQNAFSTPVPAPNSTKNLAGPPTQGLFDSLRNEQNSVQTPNHSYINQNVGTPNQNQFNQSYNQSYNDSFLNQSNFNISRLQSPEIRNIQNPVLDYSKFQYTDFWITVFGFPQSATSMILSHFSNCGTIIEKVFSPQNGNWMHIKFSSRLECDKALNYHGKILANCLMIGVTRCSDPAIVDKENMDKSEISFNRVRPLNHTGYKSVQSANDVTPGLDTPKKSSGLVNKAMDLFFGW